MNSIVGLTIKETRTKLTKQQHRKGSQDQRYSYRIVEYYLHLKQMLSFLNRQAKESRRSLGNAWRQYCLLNFKRKNDLLMNVKREELNAHVLPVFLHIVLILCL